MPSSHDKLCFVLMPFRKELDRVYTEAIKSACDKAGFTAVRADDLIGPYNIHRDIIEYIFDSSAIIADLTDSNPNVFYELGVAHAIANKTIMILQEGLKPPFDIHNYRCISYELSETGLTALARRLAEYLQHLEEWSRRPTNPVQEFKRPDHFAAPEEVKKLRRALQQKEAQLRTSVPKAELEKLQQEHQALQHKLSNQAQTMVAKTDWEALQKQLQAKAAEHAALEKENARLRAMAQPKPEVRPSAKEKVKHLRSKPSQLSLDEVKTMLANRGFYDNRWNENGKGVAHEYETKTINGDKVVLDHVTGLMWQQGGSSEYLPFASAEKYLREVNQRGMAGFTDWRLPTLEEAMSLMEREKRNDDLHIAPEFDRTQRWIWTADTVKGSASSCWVVDFYGGHCSSPRVDDTSCVRLVR
ncbi:MAG: hypothetical protein DKINENOH_03394 [bacterium]|nr:hypothetical protein [bacterium]